MSVTVGQAIRISPENAPKIAVINSGQAPDTERSLHNDEYFLILHLPTGPYNCILAGAEFRANFEFVTARNENYFVPIKRR